MTRIGQGKRGACVYGGRAWRLEMNIPERKLKCAEFQG